MNWKKGRISTVERAPKMGNDRLAWRVTFYEGDDVGYSQHDVTIHFGKDGHLFICDEGSLGEQSIYLYPTQVKRLRGLLRNIPQPKIPKFVSRKAKPTPHED